MNKVAVYRKEHFNAAHRLFNPKWDDNQNKDIFGKCSNPNFHGHNYELIVKLVGEVDPVTGFVMDMKKLSDLVQEVVVERFDHKNLNEDCAEFKNLNPTAENIVRVIYDLLKPELNEDLKMTLRLYETERNFVEYPAE